MVVAQDGSRLVVERRRRPDLVVVVVDRLDAALALGARLARNGALRCGLGPRQLEVVAIAILDLNQF